jgi:hypothetical protein
MSDDERKKLNSNIDYYKGFNSKKIQNLKNRKYWIGDNWLEFLSVAPYIFDDVFNENRKIYYYCIYHLCDFSSMLLERKITLTDVNAISHKWYKWKKLVIKVFESEIEIPNLHYTYHLIHDIPSFGSPILYSTRPYEHKHKIVKQTLQSTNHHDDSYQMVERDHMKLSFKLMKNNESVKKNINLQKKDIVYYKSKESEILIGKIIESNDKSIYLQCLKYDLGGNHVSPLKNFELMEKIIEIKIEDCIGKCSYTGEFVNRFVTLNLLEK